MKQTLRLPHRLRTISPTDSRRLLHYMRPQPGQSVTSLSALGSLSTLPLPLSAHSQYPNVFELATQDAPPSCLDTTKILSGACDVTDLASSSVFHPNRTFDHDVDLQIRPGTQTADTGSPQRVLRPARPSYTDEQRFSIM
jgi:hypothetical protein